MKSTAIAHINIALVKYWGKRDFLLNLPAVGSISITLNDLFTKTSVDFNTDLSRDILYLNGQRAATAQENRVSNFLDLIRKTADIKHYAKIISNNNFLTGSGLASSASGYAALTIAAADAAGIDISPVKKSILARQGSGSAARSIFGGYVEMKLGNNPDGSDDYAIPIADENHWPLEVLIVITSNDEKAITSTDGMKISAQTAPYYNNWVKSSAGDISQMRDAITNKDFTKLGDLAEHSCLKMHALMLSSVPPLIYWNETTMKVINHIHEMRKKGTAVFFTIDAGPQIKLICEPGNAHKLKTEFENMSGVKKVILTSLGPAAGVIEE